MTKLQRMRFDGKGPYYSKQKGLLWRKRRRKSICGFSCAKEERVCHPRAHSRQSFSTNGRRNKLM